MNFGNFVKEIREELDMSQDALARELYISHSTVNRWENGHSKPNMMAKKMLYDYCKKRNLKKLLLEQILEF